MDVAFSKSCAQFCCWHESQIVGQVPTFGAADVAALSGEATRNASGAEDCEDAKATVTVPRLAEGHPSAVPRRPCWQQGWRRGPPPPVLRPEAPPSRCGGRSPSLRTTAAARGRHLRAKPPPPRRATCQRGRSGCGTPLASPGFSGAPAAASPTHRPRCSCPQAFQEVDVCPHPAFPLLYVVRRLHDNVRRHPYGL